jgi:hypothetical protein
MPWSKADRAKYDVIRERYSSDISEAERGGLFGRARARGFRSRLVEGPPHLRSLRLRQLKSIERQLVAAQAKQAKLPRELDH